MDSLLVNVSGHLLLLSSLNQPHPSANESNHFQVSGKQTFASLARLASLQLHPPMLIASNVERTWVQTSEHQDIPHLNKALWINTGCRSMKVWLPLAGSSTLSALNQSSNVAAAATPLTPYDKKDTQRTFISRRIMLPVDTKV